MYLEGGGERGDMCDNDLPRRELIDKYSRKLREPEHRNQYPEQNTKTDEYMIAV